MKKQFISYTNGLTCNGHGAALKLVKIEVSKLDTGDIELQPVSGHSLGSMNGKTIIKATEWESRPKDPYQSTVKAVWALGLCGWDASVNS